MWNGTFLCLCSACGEGTLFLSTPLPIPIPPIKVTQQRHIRYTEQQVLGLLTPTVCQISLSITLYAPKAIISEKVIRDDCHYAKDKSEKPETKKTSDFLFIFSTFEGKFRASNILGKQFTRMFHSQHLLFLPKCTTYFDNIYSSSPYPISPRPFLNM